MDHVAGVEELSDSGVDVLLGLVEGIRVIRDFGFILVVKDHVLASVWAIIVKPISSACPILVCENL
jgi:hypothetical protein